MQELTDDIDSNGYWTVDDFEALMGLAAYRYLAQRVGDKSEEQWARTQYNSLLAATNQTLTSTIAQFHLTYLPCSMVEPNTANRCTKLPRTPTGRHRLNSASGRGINAQLFGRPGERPGLSLSARCHL